MYYSEAYYVYCFLYYIILRDILFFLWNNMGRHVIEIGVSIANNEVVIWPINNNTKLVAVSCYGSWNPQARKVVTEYI